MLFIASRPLAVGGTRGINRAIGFPAFGASRKRPVTQMSATKSEVLFYDIIPAPGSCPYAQRAWLALEEKGIPFKHVLVDPANKPEEFKELYASIVGNDFDSAKVPIIVDGDYKLTESLVVVDYLEAAYPDSGSRLLPEDPVERANVRLFAEQFTEKFNGYQFKFFGADNWAAVEELTPQFVKNLLSLDSFLKKHANEDGGSLFLGGRYSWAEVNTSPFVRRGLLTLPHYRRVDPLALAKDAGADRLVRWFEAVLDRPSLKTTGPSDEQIIETYTRFVKPIPDA